MVQAANSHFYPTLFDHSVIDNFLQDDRSKLATYRKGVRWSLMTSVRLREPSKFLSLPAINSSDAQWIVELHKRQEIIGPLDTFELPAMVYKVAIEHLTDSLSPTLSQASDTAFIKLEKERRQEDWVKIAKYLGSRPLPSSE
eukprot:10524382-Heterocapsa_arctica.AAC.1